MADTKNVPLVQEEERKFDDNNQASEKEKEVVRAVFNKFRETADHRNQNYQFLDGNNIIDYIEESVLRFITNVDIRDDIEDWQARVHDPFTRNKILAVLGKVIEFLPIALFEARGDEDIRRSQILTDLYQYSEDLDDYEEFLVYYILEAIVKGTAVGYEGHRMKSKLRRKLVNGKVKKTTEKRNMLFSEIVRLEDFYPSSVGIRKIKNMPYCFWRTVIPYQQFLQDFSRFKRAELVQPKIVVGEAGQEENPFYLDFISSDVPDGHVELLRYYNQDTDEFILLANGRWLNPTGDKEVVAPLPFDHKELPFFEVRFEPLGDFFYGKSMSDKLKSMQDVLNVLTNMLLDQSFLTIFPPLLTNGFDSIEDDYLRPGRRTPIDTQGLSIKDSVQALDMKTPTGWHQFILEYTRKIMEESSVDQVTQGIAGVGERTTAQEVRLAAAGVASMLGLFARVIKYAIKRKANLRGKNILQFWTKPGTPIIQGVLSNTGIGDFNKAFNTVKISDTQLSTGKRGTKIISMFQDKKDLPDKAELSARASVFRLETDKEIELIAVPASYIRNIEFDIKLVQNPKTEQSKESQQALQLEKTRIYMSFFPNLVDQTELAAQLAEKFGDDPSKIFKQQESNQPMDEGAVQAEVDQGAGVRPQGNTADNIVRGIRGENRIEQNITG